MHEDAKIREAEFFLQDIARSADDPDATRHYTSAFLTAARSVLLYARDESAGKRKGRFWYDSQIKIMPVVAFLSDRRDINVHKRPLPMQTNITFHIPAGAMYTSSTNITLPDTPAPTTYGYVFKGWNGPEDVVTLCGLYLDEIKRIVVDGRTKGFLSES